MQWQVVGNFQEIFSLQGSHLVRTVEYVPDEREHTLKGISFGGYRHGAIQVHIIARDAQSLDALKAAMGPMQFMRQPAALCSLCCITHDRQLIAVFFKKFLAHQPEFAPHVEALRAVMGFNLADADAYVFPAWFKEQHYDSDLSKIIYYPGNASSLLRQVFLRKNDDGFFISLQTDGETNALALLEKLTAGRQFPSEIVDKVTSHYIRLITSDKRLLKFFISSLLEYQPDFVLPAAELTAQMNLNDFNAYSIAEVQALYPATQLPAPVESQIMHLPIEPVLFYRLVSNMMLLGSRRLTHTPSPVLFSVSAAAPAAVVDPDQEFLDENAEAEWICPISNVLMMDPVYVKDSRSSRCFERSAFEGWITRSHEVNDEGVKVARHPMSNELVSIDMLVSNESMKTAIEAYRKEANALKKNVPECNK